MSIKYGVPTIADPDKEDLCVWDALSMVAQHKALRQTLESPFLARTLAEEDADTPWARLLRPDVQRRITMRGRDVFHTGEVARDVLSLTRSLGFQRVDAAVTPQDFEKALVDHGPLVYFGLSGRNLLGRRRGHALVVTGIEKRGGLYFVSYNDPEFRKPQRTEFYEFLLAFMPAWKSPRNAANAMLLHLGQGVRRPAASQAGAGAARAGSGGHAAEAATSPAGFASLDGARARLGAVRDRITSGGRGCFGARWLAARVAEAAF